MLPAVPTFPQSRPPGDGRNVPAIMLRLESLGFRRVGKSRVLQKSQVDLENSLVHVPDSKTPSGIGDMPMTKPALQAFKAQMKETSASEYLFPTLKKGAVKPYITTLKTTWSATLRRAGIPYFPLYHLRHTFASRLSAGGVSDHFVTLMLRQGDAEAFKRYSQAKLNMMREALARLDRRANEHGKTFGTSRSNRDFWNSFGTFSTFGLAMKNGRR
jgi:integrase